MINSKLQNFAKELTTQVAFMQDAEKGDIKEVFDTIVTIDAYDFLEGDDGKYVVIRLKEEKNKFFFGNSILTDHIMKIHEEGLGVEIVKEGLPVMFSERKSRKSKRMYTAVEFYPEPF